jgi:hypothetical protein
MPTVSIVRIHSRFSTKAPASIGLGNTSLFGISFVIDAIHRIKQPTAHDRGSVTLLVQQVGPKSLGCRPRRGQCNLHLPHIDVSKQWLNRLCGPGTVTLSFARHLLVRGEWGVTMQVCYSICLCPAFIALTRVRFV